MKANDIDVLTGQTESHLVALGTTTVRVHQGMLAAFERLRAKAFKAGFELEVVSGFRSFESQLHIWNRKARGERPVLDAAGNAIDIAKLSERETVYAILNWSALPGASRHHWGTDIDVIDRLSVPPRYQVQLTSEESAPGGMFADLHNWLDRHMESEGFYRPYQEDMGGVKPERWHLSYAPIAEPLFATHSAALLQTVLEAAPLELKKTVLAELGQIFDRFFSRVSHAGRVRKS